ncbi:MAG: DUF4389 domain-containing protein [Candidatus ainarchaeum sp.]|nr:DUF4389 domain-containing protein [Candidatus ainarchaeum sp.]
MDSVKVDITPGGKASRLEVIIRFIWGTIAGIILYIFLIVAYILLIINFITCLILAKRVAPKFMAAVVAQMAKLMAYMFYITDERPPLIPEM